MREGEFQRYHRDLTQWVLDETYKASIRSMRNLLDEMGKLAKEYPEWSAAELVEIASAHVVPVPE